MSLACRERARLRRQAGLAFAGSLLALPLASVAAEEEEVEEMVVVGEPRPAMDVLAGASTTRISTEDRLIEGASLDDLLSEVPGVQVRRFGGLGERFEISIRGSRPEQVPVLFDGFRLDTSLTGSSDLSTLCLDVVQEIQVTRGAGAARAGSGAIGGVVNLVPRRPGKEPETRLRAAAGSFETFEGSARHARRIGPWDLSLGYCGFHTEGDFEFQQARQLVDGVPVGSATKLERINNQADRHTGLARVGRALGEGSLRLTQLVSYLDRGTPGSEFDQRPHAEEENLSSLSSLVFEHPVSALPEGRFDLGASHRFEREVFRDPDQSELTGRDPIYSRTGMHATTLRAGLNTRVEAWKGRHRLALLSEGRVDGRESDSANHKSRAGIALRAEVESSWWGGRLRVSPSIRLEYVDGFDTEWIPAVAVEVRPLDFLTFRSAAARSYRVPSFQELYLPDKGFERGNEDLDPEEAWSFEIGATVESPFSSPWLDLELEATWFTSEIDDSIVFQLISPTTVAPVNTGRADSHGYELILRWSPHPWIRATAARTVTHAEIDETGSQIPGVAISQTDGRLELGPRDWLKLVGEIHYTGRIPVSAGGGAEIPSRTVYDASAAIDLTRLPVAGLDRLGNSLWLSLRGRNLGDSAVRDTRFFPRPGRNFSVSLESVF